MSSTARFLFHLAVGACFLVFSTSSWSLAETATDKVGTSSGSIALEEGRLDEAIAALESDLDAVQSSKDPNLADVYALRCDLGYAHMLRGDFYNAERNLEEALKFSIQTQDPVVRKNFRHRRPDICAILGLSHIYMLRIEFERLKEIIYRHSSSVRYNMFSNKYHDEVDFMGTVFNSHIRGLHSMLVENYDGAIHSLLNFLDLTKIEERKNNFLVKGTLPYTIFLLADAFRKQGKLEAAKDLLIAIPRAEEDEARTDPVLKAIAKILSNKLALQMEAEEIDVGESQEGAETLRELKRQFPNSNYGKLVKQLLDWQSKVQP